MSAELLLREFERVGHAPGAVLLLRRFVLDLAVRGKLVAPSDGAGSQVEDGGRVDSPATFDPSRAPLNTNEPFPAPDGWSWFSLAQLSHVEMGQSPASEHYNQSGDGIPFYQGKTDFGPHYPSPRYWCTKPTKIAQTGDILISVRAPVGPTNVASEICCIGRGLTALRPYEGVDRDYLLIALRAFEAVLADLGFGTTFVAINKSQLTTFPIPLPPLAEQHRIAAKVDELMSLCDQLEAAHAERELQRDALRSVSLHRLTEPEDEPADVRFFLDHSLRLITKPEHVAAVRETILDLAVRGRMVPQGDGWETTSIGRLASMVTSGSRGWAEYYSPTGAKFVRAQNIRFGKILLDDLAHVKLPRRVEGARTQVARGDVLIVITGAGVTNPALLDAELGEAYVSQHVGLVKLHNQSFSRWILLCLMARAGARDDLLERAYGSGKPGLNLDNIRSLTIPLPPLAEQHRIVAKVDELMAVCDGLEAALAAAQHERARLLESLLREALMEGSGDRAVVGDFAGAV